MRGVSGQTVPFWECHYFDVVYLWIVLVCFSPLQLQSSQGWVLEVAGSGWWMLDLGFQWSGTLEEFSCNSKYLLEDSFVDGFYSFGLVVDEEVTKTRLLGLVIMPLLQLYIS